jgi:toxin ParE1/3/4
MTSSRWDIRLAEAAQRDFQSILVWTAERFGPAQAHRYQAILKASLVSLSDGPTPPNWKARDDIAPSLRSLHVAKPGRHIVFYRIERAGVIGVVRILHDAMDPMRHVLPGD